MCCFDDELIFAEKIKQNKKWEKIFQDRFISQRILVGITP
jgi:hypothetical protein